MRTDGEVRTRIRGAVTATLQAAGAPGAAIALLVDGRPVLKEGLGHQDAAGTQALRDDGRFSLYSIAKTVLAVAALRLVERGDLDLDGSVRSVLPSRPIDPAVTFRQLLNHTGGLPDYGGLREYHAAVAATPESPWSTDEFLARTLPVGPLFASGRGWAYSNVGYLLVRLAIERRTGLALRAALADLVFRPAGLARTDVAVSLADAQDLTPGHATAPGGAAGLRVVTRHYHPGWVAHGLVTSTAPDVARFLEALVAGRLLGPEVLGAMMTPVPVPGSHRLFSPPTYGLGLMMAAESPLGRVVGHGGEGPGYSTAALYFPDLAGRRVTSVALANRERHDLGLDLAFAAAGAVADALGRAAPA